MKEGEDIDSLLSEIQKGADASSARTWLDKYLWLKIWQTVRMISNVPPDQLSTTLVALKYRLSELLLIAQETGLDMVNAQNAADRLKKLYAVQERGKV